VERILEEFMQFGYFYDIAGVHYRHPIADFGHYPQVMCD
jgi:hypothetical protein